MSRLAGPQASGWQEITGAVVEIPMGHSLPAWWLRITLASKSSGAVRWSTL